MVIGICDDEKKWRDTEREYCESLSKILGIEFEILEFSSGEDVLNCQNIIDILLLDVEMPGLDGIEIKEQLKNTKNIGNILFISWLRDSVFDSFGDKTRGFICKPIEEDRFYEEVKKIISRILDETNKDFVEIFPENRSVLININDILYIKGEGRYAKIVTLDNEYTESKNLKYWEIALFDKYIRRVHKSYLVNYKYVEDMRSTYIKVKNIKDDIPVSRLFFSIRREEFKEYRFEKYRRG